MIVGSLSARLFIREARSLKDKRQVVRSVTDRIRHDYNASVAEVEALDNRQLAVIGVAMVGFDSRAIEKAFGRMVETLRRHPKAELLDYEIDV